MDLSYFALIVLLWICPFSHTLLPLQTADDYGGTSDESGLLDEADDGPEDLTDCIEYKSQPGKYRIHGQDKPTTCGLYIIGPLDFQVLVTFEDFRVSCDNKGAVEIVDGYAHGNTIFPPVEDQVPPGHRRNQLHCGASQPAQTFRSSGNSVLVQHRLTQANDGFLVHVNFVENPQPCNAVILAESGSFVLQNYGRRMNCSVLMLFPQRITLHYVDVGNKLASTPLQRRQHAPGLPFRGTEDLVNKFSFLFWNWFDRHSTYGPKDQPSLGVNKQHGHTDQLQVLGGSSNAVLKQMTTFQSLAGYNPSSQFVHDIGCDNVMIRLVSSGSFYNQVELQHELLEGSPNKCRKPAPGEV